MMKQGKRRYSITSMTYSKSQQQNAQPLTSNLIFNHHRKGISGFSNIKNNQSIRGVKSKSLQMRKSKQKARVQMGKRTEQLYRSDEQEGRKQTHSPQVNTINLLKGNIATQDKFKSAYCKKITLSNLEKYYEYCVSKFQSKIVPQNSLKEQGEDHKFYMSQEYRLSQRLRNDPNFDFYNMNTQGNNKPGYLNKIHHSKNKNFMNNQQIKVNYSFFCRRPKTFQHARSNKIKPKGEAEEFKLEGWNSGEYQEQTMI